MGSTNKTSKFQLSQFSASDKPAWLSDYNADMDKIDRNAMHKDDYDVTGEVKLAGGIKNYLPDKAMDKDVYDPGGAVSAVGIPAYVDAKLAAQKSKWDTLWTGTWSSGSITVPNLEKYSILEITTVSSVKVFATVLQDMVLIVGGVSLASTSAYMILFSGVFARSGDQLTFTRFASCRLTPPSTIGAVTGVDVFTIRGLNTIGG